MWGSQPWIPEHTHIWSQKRGVSFFKWELAYRSPPSLCFLYQCIVKVTLDNFPMTHHLCKSTNTTVWTRQPMVCCVMVQDVLCCTGSYTCLCAIIALFVCYKPMVTQPTQGWHLWQAAPWHGCPFPGPAAGRWSLGGGSWSTAVCCTQSLFTPWDSALTFLTLPFPFPQLTKRLMTTTWGGDTCPTWQPGARSLSTSSKCLNRPTRGTGPAVPSGPCPRTECCLLRGSCQRSLACPMNGSSQTSSSCLQSASTPKTRCSPRSDRGTLSSLCHGHCHTQTSLYQHLSWIATGWQKCTPILVPQITCTIP